tara:strand:+ start:206 stop:322 length:117 start_codon:yes stop_codon:yes gene_type:complete
MKSIKELIENLKEIENKEDYIVNVDFPNPFQINIEINK